MPVRISKALKIRQRDLVEKGVYDGVLDYDSPLHIDPALISTVQVNEFRNAKQKIILYFSEILRIIKRSNTEDDIFWREAKKRIATGEGINTPLGFSRRGTGGSGIGPKVAHELIKTIKDIQKAGVDDPTIFELVSIFQEDIGPDRISDWISHILRVEFAEFTQRIASELNVKKTVAFHIDKQKYLLPKNPFTTSKKDCYVMFLPISILSHIPIVENWDNIEIAQQYNADVRQSLNDLIGDSWRAASYVRKDVLKDIFKSSPEALIDLIRMYNNRQRNSYDFKADRLGEMLWDAIGYSIANDQKLDLKKYNPITPEHVKSVAVEICTQFKNLIENNGLAHHLYDNDGKRRHERFPQLLLFAVADSYCLANNLDLTREPNAGSGALDFKFSNGLAKTNVEVKYSNNGKLVDGYQKQLIAYNKAEKVQNQNSIYLVIRTGTTGDEKIQEIKKIISEQQRLNQAYITLIVVNGIIQPSASNR